VLFELLTGTRLYEAAPEPDYRGLARKVARGEHPLPSNIDRQLAIYDPLVATALRPRSEERYQSAAELRDAIQQCLVAVNPTISTDQLGAFMREAFGDEMARSASCTIAWRVLTSPTSRSSSTPRRSRRCRSRSRSCRSSRRRRPASCGAPPRPQHRPSAGCRAAAPAPTRRSRAAGAPAVDQRRRPQATHEPTAR